MKKNLLFILLLIPFLNFGQSNQVLYFKISFAPETIYTQTTQNSSNSELTYLGSEELLEKIKNKGVENPTKVKNEMNLESVFKTGKLGSDGNFPIIIEYVKSVDKDGKTLIPSGTLIYGKSTTSGMPKLDSIASKGLDENFKNTLFQTVQSAFSQLDLPEKKLKIGESFTKETPLTIPIAGINFEMVITTTYKLNNIVNTNAFFDMVQVYTLKITDTKFDINATGNGIGKLTYNIPNHFSTQYDLNMELFFDLKQPNFALKTTSKSSFNQTVTITKNII
jgi:hypothetical protein